MRNIDLYVVEKLHLKKGIQNKYNEDVIKITTHICYLLGWVNNKDIDESYEFIASCLSHPTYPLHHYIIKIHEWIENMHVHDFKIYLSKVALKNWQEVYGSEPYDDDKIIVDDYIFSGDLFDIMGTKGTKIPMNGEGMDNCELFSKNEKLVYHEYTKKRQNLVMVICKK